MFKQKFIHWGLVFSLLALVGGCRKDKEDESKNGGFGADFSTPVFSKSDNGIAFLSNCNNIYRSKYGIDLRENSTDAYISTRLSTSENPYITGFCAEVESKFQYQGIVEPADYKIIPGEGYYSGIRLVSEYNGKYSYSFSGIIDPGKTWTVQFYSAVMGKNAIDFNFCPWDESVAECIISANRMNVITYEEKTLPTPRVFFFNDAKFPEGVKNISEMTDYFNNVLKQAVCKIGNMENGGNINVPNDVWNLKRNGEFFYDESGPNSIVELMYWCNDNGCYNENIPTLVVLPMMMEYYGFDRQAGFPGVTHNNFAVVGSDATFRDISHELLHMPAFGYLRHINDDSFVDNVMYPYPQGGANLLYRLTNNGEEKGQWNTLNDLGVTR